MVVFVPDRVAESTVLLMGSLFYQQRGTSSIFLEHPVQVEHLSNFVICHRLCTFLYIYCTNSNIIDERK